MKKIIALILALAMVLSFSACGLEFNGLATTFDNFKKTLNKENIEAEDAESAVVKVGVFEPITGKESVDADDEVKGIELAHRLFGSVAGTRIELVYADNESDPDLCSAAVQSLVDAGCIAVIGSYSNLLSLAVTDTVEEAQIPVIVPSCTNPLLTSTTNYFYRVCVVDSFQGISAAKYITEYLPYVLHPSSEDDPATEEDEYRLGGEPVQTFVLKKTDDEKATALVERFQSKMSETAGVDSYVKVMEYNGDADSFLNYLLRLKEGGAEAVFFPSSAADGEAMLYEAYSNGISFQWIGDSDWEGLIDAAQAAGRENLDHLQGVCFVSDYDAAAEEENPAATAFFDAAKTYYKESSPSQTMAFGYDAYLIVAAALRDVGTDCTPQQLSQAIARIRELQCVTGSITYLGGNGDPVKDVVIEKITGDTTEPEYTAAPNFGTNE